VKSRALGGFEVRAWGVGLVLAFSWTTAAFPQSGVISSGVAAVSDYRAQGVSSSDRGPALQGYAQWDGEGGAYAGLFVSTVDFGYPESPDYELNLYAGKTWQVDGGRTELQVEALVATYPDDRTPGPTFTNYEAGVSAKRAFGSMVLTGSAAFVPKGAAGSGRGGRLEVEAAHDPAPGWTLFAKAGASHSARALDYRFWEAGVIRSFETFAIEAKYVDTDLSRARCGGASICGAALVVGLTLFLPTLE
jgi:uncharacterized protein (TIGR02001 family)